jgi:type I restriction enzyme R subunit
VHAPKGDLEYIHYFCGNTEIPEELKSREVRRTALYKAIVSLIRAYANIADEMEAAGYSAAEITYIKKRLEHYVKLREVIRKASGETIDLKMYEADMRHLLDNYIQADDSVVISPFADMSLIDVIVKSGIAAAVDSLPGGIRGNREAVAETIENNVRKKIIKDQLLDPTYFARMSKLLDEIIKFRKENAEKYEAYLKKIADLARKTASEKQQDHPESLNTAAKRALYNNLGENESLALQIDAAVLVSKSDGWRGHQAKENQIKEAIWKIVHDEDEVERIFAIVTQQNEY